MYHQLYMHLHTLHSDFMVKTNYNFLFGVLNEHLLENAKIGQETFMEGLF